MTVTDCIEITEVEKGLLDSVMPGGKGWFRFEGDCLKTCAYYDQCDGTGFDQKTCTEDWAHAPFSVESTTVFIHVLGNFDHYDQGDFKTGQNASEVVAGLLVKLAAARQEIIDGTVIEEGKSVLNTHVRKERDNQASSQMKIRAMSDTGQLVCAACDTDYFALLGIKATRVIECHHQVPLASDGHGGKTNPEDMVLLCATCHRIAHTDESLLRVEGLRNFLATRARAD